MQRLHMPCHIDVEIVNTPDINAEKAINLSFNKKMIEDEIIRRSQGNLTHPIAHARNLRREFAWNVHQCLLIQGHWYLHAMVSIGDKFHHGFVECKELSETADNISVKMIIDLIGKVICQALVDLLNYPIEEDLSRVLDSQSD